MVSQRLDRPTHKNVNVVKHSPGHPRPVVAPSLAGAKPQCQELCRRRGFVQGDDINQLVWNEAEGVVKLPPRQREKERARERRR